MSVREYIGARYVPLFSDPLEWNSTNAYEPLTIVTYQGNSYTSKQAVPAGIDITNTAYWAQTGNYNAQIDAYRAEVQQVSSSVATNTAAIATINNTTIPDIQADVNTNTSDIATNTSAISTLTGTTIPGIQSDVSDNSAAIATNTAAITAETTARTAADTALDTRVTALEDATSVRPLLLGFGDSWLAFADQTSADWITPVCNVLDCDFENYSVGGTGWTWRGSAAVTRQGNFSEQVEYAYSQMSAEDIARVKYIVVCGGVNDFGQNNYSVSSTMTSIAPGIAAFKNACNSRFPNATIYGTANVPGWQWGANYSAKMFHVVTEINKLFQGGAIPIIPIRNFNWFLWIEGDAYSSTGIHPAKGDGLAMALLATIRGGGADAVAATGTYSTTAGGRTFDLVLQFKNGVFEIAMSPQAGSAGDANLTPSTSWGFWYDIMKIKAGDHFIAGFTGGGNMEGWGRVTCGDTPSIFVFKKDTSDFYPSGHWIIDLNTAAPDKA